ncbi:putative tyrosine carboxypeptidase MATCAP2 [Spea bombifrons]|uniref:putative tyrosine carboxypeptidase MATCAP2 n=1 Tax=Spea bombifrons TaxID=233779 RepID=UPI00234A1C5E|nr:putative tyrosine carboxypeptidase MATCAP2 [Spea bombifrons]
MKKMLESICVTEELHWPKEEFSRKSVLNVEGKKVLVTGHNVQEMSVGILRDTFRTGTSSYNVLLQSKEEEKKPSSQKNSHLCKNKKRKRSNKASSTPRGKEHNKGRTPSSKSGSLCSKRNISVSTLAARPTNSKCSQNISVSGNSIGITQRPKTKARRKHYTTSLIKGKETQVSVSPGKEEISAKKCCILNAIKPSNVEKEKIRFFKSEFTYNPQFEYSNPALPHVLAKHSHASDRFLQQAINIMRRALEKYGNYEKFEQATGGSLLPKCRISQQARKYMEKEGCLGEIVVFLTDDLLSRASMTVVNGRPTLTINTSTAREQWLEGMLRHEIGTHYCRGMNNIQQPWSNLNGRKKYGLKPVNPTEEGLASIHSVLFRKDPYLWRAALLYYTVYQASRMSFSELFRDVGKFVKDPNTRWDYCVRAKRGCSDTSQPGCFSKDQVYLDGILQILRHRHTIDFHLLISMGKISYEDIERLKDFAVLDNARIPQFLQDKSRYMECLERIMEVNELSDSVLIKLIG